MTPRVCWTGGVGLARKRGAVAYDHGDGKPYSVEPRRYPPSTARTCSTLIRIRCFDRWSGVDDHDGGELDAPHRERVMRHAA